MLRDAVHLMDARVSCSKAELLVYEYALRDDKIFESCEEQALVEFAQGAKETYGAVARGIITWLTGFVNADDVCFFPLRREDSVRHGSIENGYQEIDQVVGKDF